MTDFRQTSALDATLARLLHLHPRKIDLSLGRIERLLAALGSPHKQLPRTIHVAGTNGKGSTIAFLRAILEATGQRVHVYTSPHLVAFNERIRLAGKLASDARLIAALEACEQANAGQPITFFEIITAAAFKLFAETPADWLLLEVGLGGRVDATNVIDAPAATVITPVSLDHPEYLGSDVTMIAQEKAGIFKSGAPAILGFQSPLAQRKLEAEARRRQAPLTLARRDFDVMEEGGRLVYEDHLGLLDLPPPRLAGRHQYQNAATAIATLRTLLGDLPTLAFEQGLRTVDWPARLQNFTRGPLLECAPEGAELWLDGGHNEDCARVLSAAMRDMAHRDSTHKNVTVPLVLICGTLAAKDTSAILAHFTEIASEVIAVPVAGDHQGRAAAEVAAIAKALGFKTSQSDDAIDALRQLFTRPWPVAPRILICGSLYLAGEVLAYQDKGAITGSQPGDRATVNPG